MEFKGEKSAEQFLKKCQNKLLNEFALKLSISRPKNVGSKEKRVELDEIKENCAKIVLRNLSFSASLKDVEDLVAQLGEVKNVRMPKWCLFQC